MPRSCEMRTQLDGPCVSMSESSMLSSPGDHGPRRLKGVDSDVVKDVVGGQAGGKEACLSKKQGAQRSRKKQYSESIKYKRATTKGSDAKRAECWYF